MKTSEEKEEVVHVPVPVRYLPVVYQALADAMKANGKAAASSTPASDAETDRSGGIDWTRVENCRILRKAIRTRGGTLILDMPAETPGEWVSLTDIAERAERLHNRTIANIRADTIVLTRVIRREFGEDRDYSDWPLEANWGLNNDSQRYYRMRPDVAAAWRASEDETA